MACFIVPAAEAVITAIAGKIVRSKESVKEPLEVKLDGNKAETLEKVPFSRKLGWLNNMLWGGSALLAFEHLWHGEIIPHFPFLTAAGNAADTAEMLNEMSTVGVAMAVLVTAVWACMVGVTAAAEKKASKAESCVVGEEEQ